jgi:hypothetical protein
MSHVAKFKGDKKHGEPVQVKVEDAAAEAALLKMLGPRQEKGRDAADASQQDPPPAPTAAPVPAASPAKQAKQREATPTKPRDGTPGPGTPSKNRRSSASPGPNVRGGSGGGA